ncbi:DUF805 domain-containing protein [Maricaulis sp.]|uniref:DUF805 domain-containing protein n=1 Tax=Maricaulis sp. TaxID=1486257 RepID=UPI0026095DE2|nr:DUF805 domain-containing protein [Maricaulis sp.]
MIASVIHNLRNLTNFSGQDTKNQFWPYAGVLLGLSFLGLMLAWIPEFLASFVRAEAFAIANPEMATIIEEPGSKTIIIHEFHPDLMPNFGWLFGSLGLICAILVMMVAASVARRLRDRGKTWLWAVPPLIFLIIGAVGMQTLFAAFARDEAGSEMFGAFMLLFANNAAYLGSLGCLVYLLAGDSKTETPSA